VDLLPAWPGRVEKTHGSPPAARPTPATARLKALYPIPILSANRLKPRAFTPGELRQLVDALDPRGLYIYVMVESLAEAERLKPTVGM